MPISAYVIYQEAEIQFIQQLYCVVLNPTVEQRAHAYKLRIKVNFTDWTNSCDERTSFQKLTVDPSEGTSEGYLEAKEMRDNIMAYLKRKKTVS